MVSVYNRTARLALATLALFCLSPSRSVPLDAWPAAQPAVLDPAIEAFVGQLLQQMTLEEKVGQMIQADIASISPAELTQYKLGSILAGGNAAPGGNPRAPAQAWLNLTDAFYRAERRSPSR